MVVGQHSPGLSWGDVGEGSLQGQVDSGEWKDLLS